MGLSRGHSYAQSYKLNGPETMMNWSTAQCLIFNFKPSKVPIIKYSSRYRDVIKFSKPGGQAVMWWAYSAPTGWKRIN